MLTKTRAVVLKTTKCGESQLIADLLTEACGRLTFMLSMPKGKRAGSVVRLMQPMALLDIVFDHRPNARMQRLKEATLHAPFATIPFDPHKTAIALFLAEFTYYATRQEQANEPLFAYIANSVVWLDSCRDSIANFHIVYMMHLSKFVGFHPNLDDGAEGSYFDMRNGCFSATQPSHPDFLMPAEAARIATLMRMRYETMRLFGMSHGERNRCVLLILSYYRLHIPGFPALKSLDVLREIYA